MEQLLDLILGLDLVGPRLSFGRTEYLDEVFVGPSLDVVVVFVPSVDESLNCVAIVANDETVDVSKLDRVRGVWILT